MNEEEYLKQRVEDQIKWYSKRSIFNQSRYKFLFILQLIFSSSITVLVIFSDNFYLKIIIAILGVLVTAINSLIVAFKYFENWTSYRTTAESLKKEKYFFTTKTGIYKSDDFNLFVKNIEGLISKENSNWRRELKNKREKNENL